MLCGHLRASNWNTGERALSFPETQQSCILFFAMCWKFNSIQKLGRGKKITIDRREFPRISVLSHRGCSGHYARQTLLTMEKNRGESFWPQSVPPSTQSLGQNNPATEAQGKDAFYCKVRGRGVSFKRSPEACVQGQLLHDRSANNCNLSAGAKNAII